jgi:hypothetical protein
MIDMPPTNLNMHSLDGWALLQRKRLMSQRIRSVRCLSLKLAQQQRQ